MTQYSKINFVYHLQKWMDSVPGQTFLNYAYSWGASIVILGTLFKLTHLPGANFMLFLGMGTEVVVFFLSAFDRPFDKTADGMDLPTHVQPVAVGDTSSEASVASVAQTAAPQTVVVGGGHASVQEGITEPAAAGTASVAGVSGGTVVIGGGVIGGGSVVGGDMQTAETSAEMVEATNNYVEELRKLTEMLGKVSEQSARLTTDSEEMENLNRTLTGICKIYEMQLKSASSQMGTFDQINDQTRKMAQQIEQLNQIYARMIEAMTVNMRAAASGAVNE